MLAGDTLNAHGVFTATCYDADGNVKWEDTFDNVVCTVGKNLAFNTFLNGSAYTVTGPFMGLISNTSFTAVAAADTMASHAGWLEAGNANAPTYSGTRATCVWAAASAGAIALSASLTFTFTGAGTVTGAFIVYGTGAVNTIDSTAGTLWSAGQFTGGNKTVASTDQLVVSYSVSM
jgi:hypothetical protein